MNRLTLTEKAMMKKKFISFILTVSLLIVLIAATGTVSSAKLVAGTCGDYLNWEYDPLRGKLVINGKGDMYDYWYCDFNEYNVLPPWYEYGENINEITVSEGVRSIGRYAFYKCAAEKVALPKSLEAIDETAFSDCKVLRNRDLLDENGALYLGEWLIDAGYSFKSLQLNEQSDFTVRDGTTHIANGAFSGTYEVSSPDVDPPKINNLLTTVTIPESIVGIPDYTFRECRALRAIWFKGTEEQWGSVEWKKPDYPVFTVICSAKDNPFVDVPDGKWYTNDVISCYKNLFVIGTTEITFSPDEPITRAAFVTMMASRIKLSPSALDPYDGSSFSDVPTGKWYSRTVEWAYKNGIAAGTGDGLFRPEKPVTREELAVFLYAEYKSMRQSLETSRIKDKGDFSAFSDTDDISPWAVEAMKWAVENKLISGVGEYRLSPKSTATRAQTAVIYRNYFRKIIVECMIWED